MSEWPLRDRLNEFVNWTQLDARDVFGRLDKELEPKVFLFAFPGSGEREPFGVPDFGPLDQGARDSV